MGNSCSHTHGLMLCPFHSDLRSKLCTLVLGQCMQGSMNEYNEVTVRYLCDDPYL